MTRIFFITVLILAAMAAVAVFSTQYQGQISIDINGWEVSVGFLHLGIFLIALFLASVALVQLLLFALRIPARVLEVIGRGHKRRAMKKFSEGLISYAGGDYRRAAVLFGKAGALGAPLDGAANMLLARCMMRCGDTGKAHRALGSARQNIADELLSLLQVEIEAGSQPPEVTARRLVEVINYNPGNLRAIEYLQQLCFEKDLWKVGGEAFPHISEAYKSSDKDGLDVLSHILRVLMRDAAEKKDEQRLQWLWRNCDEQVRLRTEADYALNIARVGTVRKAEKIFKRLIEADWNREAIENFTSPDITQGARERLEQVKRWLESHPDNPTLMAAAARLYRQCGLSEQAKEYFDKSLSLKPDYKVWREAMSTNPISRH